MKGSDYLKEHKELIGLLGNTSKALRKEALAQTTELTQQLMKNPTRKNALALAKKGSNNLGKRMTTRGNRLVRRGGNVMGCGFFLDEALHGAWDLGKKAKELHNKNEADRAVKAEAFNKRMAEIDANSPFKNQYGQGIFGDVFEDLAVEGAKKLYKFDKEHGSHLKSGLVGGLKNMVGSIFKGGRGIESATRFGRGKGGSSDRPPDGVSDHRRMILEGRGFFPDMKYLDVMPEMVYPAVLPDVSDWVEKERRDTGYYGRPAILGEGM